MSMSEQPPEDAHRQHHHQHHHHVPHSHHQPAPNGVDYEAANQHHFDAAAHHYNDNPDAQRRAEKLGRAMKDTGLFKPGVTTVMDFACGTGLLSRVLAAEDPKLIFGVDISQGMVDQYNKIVSDHGIPPEEMRAVRATLREKRLEGLEGMSFDVVVRPTYLNPGGSLLIADLVHGESTHEVFPEDAHHIVAHRGGFTEEDIRATFEKAGLKNITFEIVVQAKHLGHPVDLFLARGDK